MVLHSKMHRPLGGKTPAVFYSRKCQLQKASQPEKFHLHEAFEPLGRISLPDLKNWSQLQMIEYRCRFPSRIHSLSHFRIEIGWLNRFRYRRRIPNYSLRLHFPFQCRND